MTRKDALEPATHADRETEEAAGLPSGFLDHQTMIQIAAYVSRGRVYQGVSTAEVADAWVYGFRQWVNDLAPLGQQVEDLEAELRLRGLEPPGERVEAEFEVIRRRCLTAWPPQLSGSLQDRVEAYLEAVERPAH